MTDCYSALDLASGRYCFDQRCDVLQFETRTDGVCCADGGSHAVHLAAGYRRWLTFDADDLPGQDFCAFQFDDRYAVGVVADGVSQSFFGNIAARAVGSTVMAYLWERRVNPPEKDELRDRLNAGQSSLTLEVLDHRLSETLEPMVRSALNDARSEGSQTTFGGVVLDRLRKVAHIYLLGDITAVIHRSTAALEVFSANKRGRWSSATPSLRGDISHEVRTHVASVMLKSDGAADHWGQDVCDVVRYEAFCEQARGWAENDDVSFVWLATEPVWSQVPPRVTTALPPKPPNPRPPVAREPERARAQPPARGQQPVRTNAYRHPYTPPRTRRRRPRPLKLRVIVAGSLSILTVALLTTYGFLRNHHRIPQIPNPFDIPETPHAVRDGESPPTAEDNAFPPPARDNARPRAGSEATPRRPPASSEVHERRVQLPKEATTASAVAEVVTTLARLPKNRSGVLLVVVTPRIGRPQLSLICVDGQRFSYTGMVPADGIAHIPVPRPGRYHCRLQIAGQSQDKPAIECDEGSASIATSGSAQCTNGLYGVQHLSDCLAALSRPRGAVGYDDDAAPDADTNEARSERDPDGAPSLDEVHCSTGIMIPNH